MPKQMFGAFLLMSTAYIASYTLVVGFFTPLQHLTFPTFTTSISLIFLPHGIRILAAYYYGWKSFFLLLPAVYFMWFITVYGTQIPLHPVQPIISGISCLAGIMLISKKLTYNFKKDLKFLLIAGIVGSILNGSFNSLALTQSFFTSQALYFIIGDLVGQLFLMLLFSQILKFITSIKKG